MAALIRELRAENKRLTNDLKDALGIKAGKGPTALSMVIDENKRLREALKAIMTNPSIDLGDMIYNVKDREGKGWEGPDVTAWGKALIESRKLLNL